MCIYVYMCVCMLMIILDLEVTINITSLLFVYHQLNSKTKTLLSLQVRLLFLKSITQTNHIPDIPSEIYLNEPFTLSYTVYNPTEYLADYTASIELSEAFVFSGYKMLKSRVLPLSRVSYQYTCYPLLAGKVKLPRLKVMATQQQSGEKEVPVEIAGTGISIALDNYLQPRQSSTPDLTQHHVLAFVNAKRKF